MDFLAHAVDDGEEASSAGIDDARLFEDGEEVRGFLEGFGHREMKHREKFLDGGELFDFVLDRVATFPGDGQDRSLDGVDHRLVSRVGRLLKGEGELRRIDDGQPF